MKYILNYVSKGTAIYLGTLGTEESALPAKIEGAIWKALSKEFKGLAIISPLPEKDHFCNGHCLWCDRKCDGRMHPYYKEEHK